MSDYHYIYRCRHSYWKSEVRSHLCFHLVAKVASHIEEWKKEQSDMNLVGLCIRDWVLLTSASANLKKKHMRLFKEGTKILLDAIRSDSWISLSLSNNYDTFKFNLTPNSLNNLATQRCMLRHRMHLM